MATAQAPGASSSHPPRGPWTESLLAFLTGGCSTTEWLVVPEVEADPLHDDDLQLALYVCYELHYADVSGVDGHMHA